MNTPIRFTRPTFILIPLLIWLSALPAQAKPASKYDHYLNSVVVIESSDGLGTGFFINNRGRLLTNRHVVGEDKRVTVKLRNERVMEGQVLKTWPQADLAVVAVKLRNKDWLSLARKDEGGVGDDVIAVGTPQGLSWSVSRGIISSIRDVENLQLVQTDAAINSGNSGGPLILVDSGRVVGVNTLSAYKFVAEGISFAVSAETVKKICGASLTFADSGAKPGPEAQQPEIASQDEIIQKARRAFFKGKPGATVRYLRPLAQAGNAEAQHDLGTLYKEGIGVKPNYHEAARWLRKAAKQKVPEAMVQLGDMYYQGLGLTKNQPKACKWYRQAADLGLAVAMFHVGACYAKGGSGAVNHRRAADWYRRGAEGGSDLAMVAYGYALEKGKGVNRNYRKAAYWYQEAAKRDNPTGQFLLGGCYITGRGVNQDRVLAQAWFILAAERGSKHAAKLRDELDKKLNSYEILLARQIAAEFKPEK